ncbi:hypothetical protein [Rubrolithibacter danxiaensis]|uniref:hypothetical protein n=1 Tax=Rubrolithibacter danxiaensis TaxID=3390805 RepID=UPI003BF87E91
MIDPHKEKGKPTGREDEINADISDENKKDPNIIDAVKTEDDKEGRYYDKPFDEQMYGSFAELKEQRAPSESTEEELKKKESE